MLHIYFEVYQMYTSTRIILVLEHNRTWNRLQQTVLLLLIATLMVYRTPHVTSTEWLRQQETPPITINRRKSIM